MGILPSALLMAALAGSLCSRACAEGKVMGPGGKKARGEAGRQLSGEPPGGSVWVWADASFRTDISADAGGSATEVTPARRRHVGACPGFGRIFTLRATGRPPHSSRSKSPRGPSPTRTIKRGISRRTSSRIMRTSTGLSIAMQIGPSNMQARSMQMWIPKYLQGVINEANKTVDWGEI